MSYTPLKGSERTLSAGVSVIGKVNPHAVIRVTLQVKPSRDMSRLQFQSAVQSVIDNVPRERKHLSREEFAATHGIMREDVQKVRRFAEQFGLRIVPDLVARKTRANPLGQRTVELEGRVGAFSRAFKVQLLRVRDSNGVHRERVGPLQIPNSYADVIENVLGLDNRPQAKPRSRPYPRLGGFAPYLGASSYNPNEVAKLYNFPQGVTGKGQTIALIELGGGYRLSDLQKYFKQINVPQPVVSAVSVGAGANRPTGNPDGPDGEVMLDIEVAGAVAPSAKIVAYFGANTNRGFLRAIHAAIHDQVHKPSIISISWGQPEAQWAAADMNTFTEAFQAAALMGISVFVAAGDDGSSDGVEGRAAHVDFPASSPYATACGGTKLVSVGGRIIAPEVVWNEGSSGGTGGGISDVFDVPPYQKGPAISIPESVNGGRIGRGVPDIAGNADPSTGYNVRVDGIDTVIGGTSAVAPLWAGLFALINEHVGLPVGFVNTLLYGPVVSTAGAINDVIHGNNDTTGRVGGYSAAIAPGWDPCTGLGTPNGALILSGIMSAQ